MALRTWYCSWVLCGRHFDAYHPDALPKLCPWCSGDGWWALDPPPFETQLTAAERRWFEHGAVRDGKIAETEKG